LTRRAACR